MKRISEITIIGFGNQAKSWALNLRDSGVNVYIALRRDSKSIAIVRDIGFQVVFLDENPPTDYAAILTPDESHPEILEKLKKNEKKLTIIYAHGFSIYTYKLNEQFPNFKHLLLAPKCIASELRFRFETKQSLTCFYSIEFGSETDILSLRSVANAIGAFNFYPTTFREETQADLFSEQTVLCSVLPHAINEAFNTLIKKGYSKEIAFYECFYEAKLILDTIYKVGPKEFFNFISPNALIGSVEGTKILFTKDYQEKLNFILSQIEAGNFTKKISPKALINAKKDTIEFWEQQKLQTTFEELKDTL